MNILGLILSIAVLIFLIYKGINAIVSSIIAALVAGLTNGFSVWGTLNDFYIPGFMNFAGRMFFVFLLATIYGKMISESGSAHKIAYTFVDIFGKKRVMLIIGLTTGVLVYGGVSAMVVVFTVLPIGYILIKEANIPMVLLPAAITWGQATFAMGAFPGSPQMPNILPGTILGTSPTSAPIMGIICGVVMIVLGYAYLQWQVKRYHDKGIGFDENSKINLTTNTEFTRENCPGTLKAFSPLVLLVVLYLMLSNGVLGIKMDGITAVNTAMFASIVLLFLLNTKNFKGMMKAFMEGTREWTLPLFNFTCMIAFGFVIQNTPAFASVADWLLGLPGSVYVSALVATSITCGITGSASGGSGIALNALSGSWLSMGANPAILHRVVSITSTGLDSLPHCGGITTVFGLSNVSIKEGYKHAFISTTMVPLLAAVISVILASLGIA